jgi:hypothetical protein
MSDRLSESNITLAIMLVGSLVAYYAMLTYTNAPIDMASKPFQVNHIYTLEEKERIHDVKKIFYNEDQAESKLYDLPYFNESIREIDDVVKENSIRSPPMFWIVHESRTMGKSVLLWNYVEYLHHHGRPALYLNAHYNASLGEEFQMKLHEAGLIKDVNDNSLFEAVNIVNNEGERPVIVIDQIDKAVMQKHCPLCNVLHKKLAKNSVDIIFVTNSVDTTRILE